MIRNSSFGKGEGFFKNQSKTGLKTKRKRKGTLIKKPASLENLYICATAGDAQY